MASGVGSYRSEIGDADCGMVVQIGSRSQIFESICESKIERDSVDRVSFPYRGNLAPWRQIIWGIVLDKVVLTIFRPGLGPGIWYFAYRVLTDSGRIAWFTDVSPLEGTRDPFRRDPDQHVRCLKWASMS